VKTLSRWPLILVALPAAVAVWSGWVGLGQLCGFGIIHPLPGIWDTAHLNTAITLPIGVEAYGSCALSAWLDSGTPQGARRFAKWSAIGALTLGMLGQVVYHLLSAAHVARAPWPVVVLVSSLPVTVLGFGAALSHLLRGERSESEAVSQVRPEGAPEPLPAPAPESAPGDAPESALKSAPKAAPRAASRPGPKSGVRRIKAPAPAMFYAAELAAGEVPSLRKIRADLHVGQERAKAIRGELEAAMTEGTAVAAWQKL
jgi:hypothetical protein